MTIKQWFKKAQEEHFAIGAFNVANKVDGIRSALVDDQQRAAQARVHEDANVISLPADILDEEETYQIVKTFLETDFSGEKRHERRIEKITEIEKDN
jgi:ribose 5-phosphate isomerase B